MYFTDEVILKTVGDAKFVNEFQVLESIGKGSFSKVKRVVRRSVSNRNEAEGIADADEEDVEIAEFAMKIMHKPSLKNQRAIRYDTKGEMHMINNYVKVQSEIEIWTTLNHPYIAKLFEMIDDEQHDYIYLIIELADMGQIAVWNFKTERYEHNQQIVKFVLEHLKMHNGLKANVPEIE